MLDKNTYGDTGTHSSAGFKVNLENLKQKNHELKGTLQKQRKIKGNDPESYIARLKHQEVVFTAKIEEEKERRLQLQARLKELQQPTRPKRKKDSVAETRKPSGASEATLTQRIKQTENKLDKALQKYNDVVVNNKDLRTRIDQLRQEKVLNLGIKHSLKEELAQKKTEFTRIEKLNETLNEQRKGLKRQLEEAKARVEQERTEFSQKLRQVDECLKLQSPTNSLAPESLVSEAAERATDYEHQRTLENIKKDTEKIEKEISDIKNSVEEAEHYEHTFKQIEEATKIHDKDKLVETLIKTENQNYSLFNYIKELYRDIENLESEIAQVEAEKEKYKNSHLEDQTTSVIKDIQASLDKAETRAANYQVEFEKTSREIDELKRGIQSILEQIGCNNPEADELIRTQGVDEANMEQFLALLEERVNQLFESRVWAHYEKQREKVETKLKTADAKQRHPQRMVDTDAIVIPEKETKDEEQILSPQTMRDRATAKMFMIRKK